MKADKYNRNVTLLCPTCGEKDFSNVEDLVVKCTSCGLRLSKEDLIQQNDENIQENIEGVKQEIVNDITKKLTDAFKGFK